MKISLEAGNISEDICEGRLKTITGIDDGIDENCIAKTDAIQRIMADEDTKIQHKLNEIILRKAPNHNVLYLRLPRRQVSSLGDGKVHILMRLFLIIYGYN